MCAVSMTINAVRKQWPPVNRWPRERIVDFSEVLRKLEAIERKLNITDCHDDKKDKFLKELSDRLEKLECAVQVKEDQ